MNSNIPLWVLSLIYWLHMLATVVWIGGLAALSLLVLPAAQQSLETPAYANLLAAIQRRLDPLGWFCLALLGATGMVQMSVNENYTGFLAVTGAWGLAILVKHIVIVGMVGVSAYLTWGLLPRLRRMALLSAKVEVGTAAGQVVSLQRQQVWMLRLNLALAVVVLLLTSIARSA